jgi:site-specific DNA-methyltransferase (adenine-specific)
VVGGTANRRFFCFGDKDLTPYFQRDGVQLFHGDSRELLPTLAPGSVDVLTDPPYGLGKKMQGGTWATVKTHADMWDWDVLPADAIINQIAELGRAVIWGGQYFRLPPSRCWLVWDKKNAVHTTADCEMAWTNLDRPTKRFSFKVGDHKTGHPTQKPLPLFAWCLKFLEGDKPIFDPFMGSVTSGIVAAREGRGFIGAEACEKYIEIAAKRLEAALHKGPIREFEWSETEEVF